MGATIQDLKEAQAEIDDAVDNLEAVKQRFIQEHSPWQIGDTITVNGYSHTGKKMIVKRITLRARYHGDLEFTAKGPVLKSDETPGLLTATSTAIYREPEQ